MKIFRITLICLWALILLTTGDLQSQGNLVKWKSLETMNLGGMDSSGTTKDTIYYIFPHSGDQRYGDTKGNLHFRFTPTFISNGTVDNSDSLTIAYQCLSYANDNFFKDSSTVTKNTVADIVDGTIVFGGTDFPVFTNYDWTSGSKIEYPNLTSVLYPYGPCIGIALIGTYTTVDDSDSVSVPTGIDQQ